jgi:hypothetical protein
VRLVTDSKVWRKWQDTEIAFIRANKDRMTIGEIGGHLGRSHASVKARASNMGITGLSSNEPKPNRPKRKATLLESHTVEVYALIPPCVDVVESSVRELPAGLVVWLVDPGEYQQSKRMSIIELEDYGRCRVPRDSLKAHDKKASVPVVETAS